MARIFLSGKMTYQRFLGLLTPRMTLFFTILSSVRRNRLRIALHLPKAILLPKAPPSLPKHFSKSRSGTSYFASLGRGNGNGLFSGGFPFALPWRGSLQNYRHSDASMHWRCPCGFPSLSCCFSMRLKSAVRFPNGLSPY